jgi:hypothetical protein
MKILTSFLVCDAIAAFVSVAAEKTWNTITGNACGDLEGCKCTNGECKDVPGQLHYVGMLDNATSCGQTCESDPNKKCNIWLWSSSTKHCFWRLDDVWDVEPAQTQVTSACLESSDDPSLACVSGCGSCGVVKNYTNMNGFYNLSDTAHSDTSKFPENYHSYPGAPDYFEIYSPTISSLYSQVFWTRLPSVDLPIDIVERFKGKTMAVVGFEMDQVRRTKEGDVSVPINVAYNHHFESTMIGGGARFEKIEVENEHDPRLPDSITGHRRPNMSEAWIVVTDEDDMIAANGIPTSVGFGAANGGEYRKSFHGYAPGQAQLIYSPKQMSITPMQIDTWNRDKMNIEGGPFVPGPVPRTSLAPLSGPDALYSGLLECPVTTRLRKNIQGGSYEIKVQDNCQTIIESPSECFAAAPKIDLPEGTNLTYSIADMPGFPSGCIAMVDSFNGGNASVSVVYNKATANASATCGASSPPMMVSEGSTDSLTTLKVKIDTPNDLVTISMTGPADVWFGVGFGATQMKNSPWAIIVEPSSGASSADATVSERKLADNDPGQALKDSITVVSHTIDPSANTRTIVATRRLKGISPNYYTFNAVNDVSLNFINAVGSGPILAYHKDKTASSIEILPLGSQGDNFCICPSKPVPFGQGVGTFEYVETGTKVGCCNTCSDEPRSDMIKMQNPTCDLRTYAGGQLSCHHMWSLLDADQDIPWSDQPLNYSLKFRFWIQEYNETGGSAAAWPNADDKVVDGVSTDLSAPSHLSVRRTTWGIASPVEYDVPKCDNQTLGCSQTADGNWVHTIQGQWKPSPSNINIVAMHFHCHAPTCLSVALYNNKTGELICEEKPIYGGTGKIEGAGFDEPGYIAQPPCLFGDAAFGLDPPPNMEDVVLHAVKTSNATYGHHGEMAWLQMMYVNQNT